MRKFSLFHIQADVCVLLGYHAASLDIRYATFKENAVPSSLRVAMSTFEGEDATFSPYVGNRLRSNAA